MSPTRPEIATVIGPRPQFVKCAFVSRALRRAGVRELLIHTGQHYDNLLSDVFFRELEIPSPDVNLGVGSGTQGWQTATALIALEQVFLERRPRLALVYGDTNSTLAGALAAVKLGIPLAHVEAGLRSYNRAMPEEHNRVATDHWSDLLFCHNAGACERLRGEGIRGRTLVVGDVMREMLAIHAAGALAESRYPSRLDLEPGGYVVLTVHRPVNTGPAALRAILNWCRKAPCPVVFPAHPRIRTDVAALIGEAGAGVERIRQLPPLGYADMLATVAGARMVLTDSGGLQKEAFFLGVPCVTLRGETEWIETVAAGGNVLAGDRPSPADIDRAAQAIQARPWPPETAAHQALVEAQFGAADASRRIVEAIVEFLRSNREEPPS